MTLTYLAHYDIKGMEWNKHKIGMISGVDNKITNTTSRQKTNDTNNDKTNENVKTNDSVKKLGMISGSSENTTQKFGMISASKDYVKKVISKATIGGMIKDLSFKDNVKKVEKGNNFVDKIVNKKS